jgi:hypothetical protein
MKIMIIKKTLFKVATFMFLIGCTPDQVTPVIDKDGYYSQVVELLDPDNPNPPVTANDRNNTQIHDLCGVKVGMSMADVISVWGKPRALGVCKANNASLLYGPFVLWFDHDKLKSISPAASLKWKQQTEKRPLVAVQPAFAQAYYEKLNNFFITNRSVHASEAIKTNSVISIAKLKEGGIEGMRLGMTMSEVVTLQGKPRYFCRFSTKRAILSGLGSFRGNSLCSFGVSIPDPCQGMTFDNGMSLNAPIDEYVKTFGTPLRTYRFCCKLELSYQFGKNYVTFDFYIEDGDTPGVAKQISSLNGISLHYRGVLDAYAEADDQLISSVSVLTSLDRDKLHSLRTERDVIVISGMLEKEMGKRLTDLQRKKITTLLEKNKATHEKAYREDAE